MVNPITDLRGVLPRTAVKSAQRTRDKITMLVVHHAGDGRVWPDKYDALQEYKNEATYHINKDWGGGYHGNGLQYHYKIDRQGTIYRTRNIEDILWHASNANNISIGICLDGDLTKQHYTKAQEKSLYNLLDEICAWLNIKRQNVFGHGELKAYGNYTACPGVAIECVIKYRDGHNEDAQEVDFNQFRGKTIKAEQSPIYFINNDLDGFKIPDLLTMYAYGLLPEDVIMVSQGVIDDINKSKDNNGYLHYKDAPMKRLIDSMRAHRDELKEWI